MRTALFLTAIVFLSAPTFALAATLSAVPSKTSVQVGDTVSISLYVDSEGVAINNAEGELTFSKDLFDVVSVNKDASLFSLWIEAPAYDGNSSVSFNGGLPSPGYQGSNGRLFTVTLRARAAGHAPFAILNGAVRANDGLGTDVLHSVSGGSVDVTAASSAPQKQTTAPETDSPAAQPAAASALLISSATHPDQASWYNNKSPVLSWNLPSGADAVQTVVSQNKSASPQVTYRPPVTQKTLDPLDDGIWYFNIRAHTPNGWGSISSYTLRVDTLAPTLSASINFDATSSTAFVQSAAADSLSGIRSYELLVDGFSYAKFDPSELSNGFIRVPLSLFEGQHTLQWEVSDMAGNTTKSDAVGISAVMPPDLRDLLWSKVISFNYGLLLLPLTLLVSLVSLALNVVLWSKLRYIHHLMREPRVLRKPSRRKRADE